MAWQLRKLHNSEALLVAAKRTNNHPRPDTRPDEVIRNYLIAFHGSCSPWQIYPPLHPDIISYHTRQLDTESINTSADIRINFSRNLVNNMHCVSRLIPNQMCIPFLRLIR